MLLSFSKHIAYNFLPVEVDFIKLKEAIGKEFYIINSVFKDNHKNGDNWLSATNCLIFDFDMHVKIETIQDMLKGYKHLIHTTKNHNKEKNGIISERFRLYLPTRMITLPKDKYEFMLKELNKTLCSDLQCAICSQAFKGYKDAEIFEADGKIFDWAQYWNAISSKFSNKPTQQHYKINNNFMDQDKWEKMFNPSAIGEGERNRQLARYLYWSFDEGRNRDEAETILMWINSRVAQPLPEKEITAMLKSKFGS